MANKNIAIFFDGTWNKPKTNTNVYKGFTPLAQDEEQSNGSQLTKYIAGVGSARWTWLRGGAFGKGIRKNIVDGYKFLADNYVKGDRIYLFGFSRGAYTARSLAGMIVRYGLVEKGAPIDADRVFDVYTKKEDARQITKLWKVEPEQMNEVEKLIFKHSHRVDIQFMGIWDTVGMIGVPKGDKFGLNNEHKFHHQNVSTLFQNIAHALSINENRGLYKPTLFFKYEPDSASEEDKKKALARFEKRVEQRWFSGSHGCVGGSAGNRNEVIPLSWVYSKAKDAGLLLQHDIDTSVATPTGVITDSYKTSFLGIPALFSKRHHRPIGRGIIQREGYSLTCINEKIDGSVFDRCNADPSYRPPNLVEWAQRKGVDLANTTGDKQV
jgi:uncharacterized protein (DUF2235 family)